MPLQLDSRAIKTEARSLLHTGEVNPFKLTLFYLLISLVLDTVNAGVSYAIESAGGFTVLSFSFVSILIGLVSLVLNAGYFCYCFGILRREQMPYDSLFDAFPFAGKVILLSIVEGIFIFLWSMLFVIPGIVAAYRYSFAMLNLCENPDLGVMEALDLSKRQTNGYKMQLFLLQLSFIGYQLAAALIAVLYEYAIISFLPDSLPGVLLGTLIYSVLAAGVGVYLTPYLNLSICRFYPAIRQAAPSRPTLTRGIRSSDKSEKEGSLLAGDPSFLFSYFSTYTVLMPSSAQSSVFSAMSVSLSYQTTVVKPSFSL